MLCVTSRRRGLLLETLLKAVGVDDHLVGLPERPPVLQQGQKLIEDLLQVPAEVAVQVQEQPRLLSGSYLSTRQGDRLPEGTSSAGGFDEGTGSKENGEDIDRIKRMPSLVSLP